ncbi:MAG: hypothetical protein ACRBB3_02420 [Alphaproteobacteria bacterium]
MDRKNKVFHVYLWVLSGLALIPWLLVQYQKSVNCDVSWLTVCVKRLISGLPLSQGCFDTNPPLNVLIYSPFALIAEALSIETYNAIFCGTLFLIILLTITTYKTLKYFKFFNENDRFLITLGSLCTLTIIPALSFAERDHFIAIAILPFVLTQLAITYKYSSSWFLKYFTIIVGSVLILIKPHFGLIPAFIFIHRAVYYKSILKVIKSPDFIILSIFSTSYLLIVYFFFRDFIDIILPDVLRFYLNYNNPKGVYFYAKIYALLAFACLTFSLFIKDKDKRTILSAICLCSFLALAVFVIQMKGFSYHRLPFYALLFPFIGMLIHNIVTQKMNLDTWLKETILLHVIIGAIFLSSYQFSPLRPDYPTHNDYKNNDLMTYINKHCEEPCSYFMTYENMDISSQIAFYSGHTYATRFPAYWFQPAFEGSVPTAINDKYEESIDDAKLRYANYIVKDFETMRPTLLFILKAADGSPTNFAKRFAANSPKVRDIFATYKHIGVFSMDRAYFYKDTKYDFEHIIMWDVYKKPTQKLKDRINERK